MNEAIKLWFLTTHMNRCGYPGMFISILLDYLCFILGSTIYLGMPIQYIIGCLIMHIYPKRHTNNGKPK